MQFVFFPPQGANEGWREDEEEGRSERGEEWSGGMGGRNGKTSLKSR